MSAFRTDGFRPAARTDEFRNEYHFRRLNDRHPPVSLNVPRLRGYYSVLNADALSGSVGQAKGFQESPDRDIVEFKVIGCGDELT